MTGQLCAVEPENRAGVRREPSVVVGVLARIVPADLQWRANGVMTSAANAAAAVKMDARAAGALVVGRAGIPNEQTSELEQALLEHARGSEQVGYVLDKVVWPAAVRVGHDFEIVPGIFRKLMVVRGRAVGINAPALAQHPDAAVSSFTDGHGRVVIRARVAGDHAQLQRFKVTPPARKDRLNDRFPGELEDSAAMAFLVARKARAIAGRNTRPIKEPLPLADVFLQVGPHDAAVNAARVHPNFK